MTKPPYVMCDVLSHGIPRLSTGAVIQLLLSKHDTTCGGDNEFERVLERLLQIHQKGVRCVKD